ncbi:ammonium transporter 1 member 3-like [Ceratina calcarata]|uniref:Ammonium transporter 1 member 3-like n=1 Tax=Ceratina calcarata TaxID=156304 RepID=A0AAJ7ITQ2_9HYME|nr:ammonium transporter 1 member 3-like [Ceratina calcarata]
MSNVHVYDYNLYYQTIRSDGNITAEVVSSPSSTRVFLVVLLRIGFTLVHVGSVPVNNVNLILLQNIIDFAWVTFVYLVIGSIIAYTGDTRGVIGGGYWIGEDIVDKDEVLVGWAAVVIAAAICTCGIVGRTHTVGYLIIGFLLAGLVQPFMIHWIWTGKGWMRMNELNDEKVHFHDFAGSTVIHLVGGLSGLIGCMILGRRILRLDSIDEASIAIGSSGTVYAGQLMVFMGLQAAYMPCYQEKKRLHYSVYVNNLLAASACSLLVVLYHFLLPKEEFNHWTVMRCVQAMVAGLVMISAGADIYSPAVATCLGASASILFYLTSRQIFRSALEDYCNMIAIHLVCSILGSLLVPLFVIHDNNDASIILMNFLWHLICLAAIICSVSLIMFTAFAILQCTGLLRNRSEHLNHLRATIAEGRASRRKTFLERLFRLDNNSTFIQPGTSTNEPSGRRF